MFTALTENFGDMRNKINAFVALAPVMRLGHSSNEMLQKIAKDIESYKIKMEKSKIYSVQG
jgi:hypothetical protein